jgi:hypothetical protein
MNTSEHFAISVILPSFASPLVAQRSEADLSPIQIQDHVQFREFNNISFGM